MSSKKKRASGSEDGVNHARKKRVKPEKVAECFVEKDEDPDGFQQKFINSFIGCGVFTTKDFERGSFLLHYRGELLSGDKGIKRLNEAEGSFIYFFRRGNKEFCIDALQTEGLGKMANHSRKKANSRMQKLFVNGRVHLCLFAICDLHSGEQLLYDYGIPDAEIPWLKEGYAGGHYTRPDGVARVNATSSLIKGFGHSGAEVPPMRPSRPTTTQPRPPMPIMTTQRERMTHKRSRMEQQDIGSTHQIDLDPCVRIPRLSYQSTLTSPDLLVQPCVLAPRSPTHDQRSMIPQLLSITLPRSDVSISEPYNTTLANVHGNSAMGKKGNLPQSQVQHKSPEMPHLSKLAVTGEGWINVEEQGGLHVNIQHKDARPHDSIQPSSLEDISMATRAHSSGHYAGLQTNGYRQSFSSDDDQDLDYLLDESDLDSVEDPTFQPADDDLISESEESGESDIDVNAIPMHSHSGHGESAVIRSPRQAQQPNGHSNDDGITVKTYNRREDGRKRWDKKHYCVFCEKAYAKLPRHFVSNHSSEREVALLSSYDQRIASQKIARQRLLDDLRKRGDFNHNSKVIESGTGELVTKKSTASGKNYQAYIPCEYCFGFYFKQDLYRHIKSCPQKPSDVPKHTRHQSRGALLLPTSSMASVELNNVMSRLIVDDISLTLQSDETIIAFGEKMVSKYKKLPHMHQIIRTRMRELGRLLAEVKKTNMVHSLAECLKPSRFSIVVNSVQSICGDSNSDMAIPSLALKLGYSLHACAKILISKALRSGDEILKRDADDFIKIYELDWSTEISSLARRTLEEARFNKPCMLPLTEDIVKLQKYMNAIIKRCISGISDRLSPCWRDLCQCLLATVIMFNRRRSGEVERITIDTFKCLKRADVHPDIINALCPVEQSLFSSLARVEIRGKRGRKVPIILTEDMVTGLNTLISSRKGSGGINSQNVFLFANNALGHLRGHDTLRELSDKAGVKNRQSLTSTRLRKHIATLSQLVNLKDHELDILANFMGHDVRIHRNFYRLPEDTLQLAKVGKLLLAASSGTMAKFAGKSLDDIQIDQEVSDESESEAEAETEENDRELPDCNATVVTERTVTSDGSDIAEENEEADVQAPSVKVVHKTKKRPWGDAEKHAVYEMLGAYIRRGRGLPGKLECTRCLQTYPNELKNRDWLAIKNFVRNRIVQLNRQIAK